MPPLDWNSVPSEQLNPSLARRVIHTATMTIARLSLKAGGAVPVHVHHNEQVSMVESGRLRFLLPDGPVEVGPGQVLHLPANLPHGVEVIEDAQVVDLFSPPREDWKTGDDAYLRG